MRHATFLAVQVKQPSNRTSFPSYTAPTKPPTYTTRVMSIQERIRGGRRKRTTPRQRGLSNLAKQELGLGHKCRVQGWAITSAAIEA